MSVVYTVEIFVPRRKVDEATVEWLTRLLEAMYGGFTAYDRKPARGGWRGLREDMLIIEAMVPELDRAWWTRLREHLEGRLDEKEILIRAVQTEQL